MRLPCPRDPSRRARLASRTQRLAALSGALNHKGAGAFGSVDDGKGADGNALASVGTEIYAQEVDARFD